MESEISLLEICTRTRTGSDDFRGVMDAPKVSTTVVGATLGPGGPGGPKFPCIYPRTTYGSVATFYCPHIRSFDVKKDIVLVIATEILSGVDYIVDMDAISFAVTYKEVIPTEWNSESTTGVFWNPSDISGSAEEIAGGGLQNVGFVQHYHGAASVYRIQDISLTMPAGIISSNRAALIISVTPTFNNPAFEGFFRILGIRLVGDHRFEVDEND